MSQEIYDYMDTLKERIDNLDKSFKHCTAEESEWFEELEERIEALEHLHNSLDSTGHSVLHEEPINERLKKLDKKTDLLNARIIELEDGLSLLKNYCHLHVEGVTHLSAEKVEALERRMEDKPEQAEHSILANCRCEICDTLKVYPDKPAAKDGYWWCPEHGRVTRYLDCEGYLHYVKISDFASDPCRSKLEWRTDKPAAKDGYPEELYLDRQRMEENRQIAERARVALDRNVGTFMYPELYKIVNGGKDDNG